jgi:hypothetical protein
MTFQTQFQVWAEVFFRLKTRAQGVIDIYTVSGRGGMSLGAPMN